MTELHAAMVPPRLADCRVAAPTGLIVLSIAKTASYNEALSDRAH